MRETHYRDPMPPTPDTTQPLPPLETLRGSPTAPGWYWFKNEMAIREMMFEVRLMDGELCMLKFYEDIPVVDAKGSWRGPLKPSSGPCHE